MIDQYELKHPIARASGSPITLVEVTRRPRLKDLRLVAIQKDELAQNAKAIACITNLPPAAVEELDVDDFKALAALVGPLFSPQTEGSGESSGEAPDGS